MEVGVGVGSQLYDDIGNCMMTGTVQGTVCLGSAEKGLGVEEE